ncbi:hypothetical protein D3C72_1409530 [compost metagenome]
MARGYVGLPVGAGDHDLVGVGGDYLLGVELAEGAGNHALGNVRAPRHFHVFAEVLVAKAQAAVFGVAADAFDEHLGARGLLGGDGVCHAPDLRRAVRDELFSARFLAKQPAHQAHGGLGVLHGAMAKVHIHHRNSQRRQFLDVARVIGGPLGLDVQQDHVGLLRNGLLDVEGAVFKAPKGGNVGDAREFLGVRRIGVRVGLDQILAPAHDALDRVVRIECGHQVQLPPFSQDHALHR